MNHPPERYDIESILARFSGDALDVSSVAGMTTAYRELLARDGVLFPGPNLTKYRLQWDAWAASHRGAEYLTDEGELVDMAGFDEKSGVLNRLDSRIALDNEEKLRSLVDLSIIAKAGDLAEAATIAAIENGSDMNLEVIKTMKSSYKHFVQIAMATEKWGEPWLRFVDESFSEESAHFPLDKDGVLLGIDLMRSPLFKETRNRHFGWLALMRHNMLLDLERNNGDNPAVTHDMIRIAALIGMSYVHSPDSSVQIVYDQMRRGNLTHEVSWANEIHNAANYALDLKTIR